MFCIHCGNEIKNDSKFCCYCGNQVEQLQQKQNANRPSVRNKVFAYIGFGHGIAAFVMSFIPLVCIYSFLCAIPGIIFSCLGKKSEKEKYAKKGRLFSVLGLIISFIMTIITFVLLIFLFEYVGIEYEILTGQWYF